MTKRVRVENADNSPYRVVVQVWDKGFPDKDGNKTDDKLAFERTLAHPTDMTGDDIYITSSRYLVVKEADPVPKT